ncbi:ABC-3 metal transporter [Dinoroseobacter shibae DFL 12 = DSM 16493]|jgi:manganese/iron transport system permease protein|uniref:ABC-3 metal transporter n=1 Tax=Dinoroseobacter shibae (strain DSM 16493 / NCIMB 14021 / DFL 12) TaxID=398580 RepID=A8LLM0_DINSH|nr:MULTISPECIES: metal ABC transporter permease [Dinoroseobacter]ABV93398.1 ABC-3 metal transporter [Dinoroseobacter shibae DFL 12 = DSM 16493]MDD9715507.1 metal ABC transporter permease [Dinoroseobacter sp. PD6]URF48313.1 metal ABC transporter permease [Dinoroseobacter shibae]URF52623.1 metal ABC transporter permease [Dinoroseobacter shibae]
MIDTLFAPFQFPFMQNAFLIAVLISVPTAILSCFVVLKGWSLMGDAISHAVLPGIVLAYVLGIPLIFGAFAAGMTCALATGYLQAHSRVKQDTVMGVVFSGMFGLGLVIYTKIETNMHLDHILFGNMLGIGSGDLATAGIIAVVVAGILLVKWRDFLLHAFDPAQARAVGLRVAWLHYGLLALISLTIVAVLKAVGIILAIGLLIAPGAIAFLVTKRFVHMLWIAVAVTCLASISGVYASFWLDSAPAPTIILILSAVFVAAFVHKLWRAGRTEQRTEPLPAP